MPPAEAQEFLVDITDELTLTPFAGASLINEILKGLLYQKRQIPYSFSRLKQVVEKRRKALESASNAAGKSNFTHDHHYRTVSKTYDALDSIMKGVNREFCDGSSGAVKEVVVVLGDSPFCAKEVFSIAVPNLSRRHFERNHCGELNRHLPKVLRSIFLSQEWVDCMDATFPCTNVYVYLKKRSEATPEVDNEDGPFRPCQPPHFTSKSKYSRIRLNYVSNKSSSCCKDIPIFDESGEEVNKELQLVQSQLEDEDSVSWYRSCEVLKGYKDHFVNGASISDLW